jgi:hypothetical protein
LEVGVGYLCYRVAGHRDDISAAWAEDDVFQLVPQPQMFHLLANLKKLPAGTDSPFPNGQFQ